jgi:hypothetical protein
VVVPAVVTSEAAAVPINLNIQANTLKQQDMVLNLVHMIILLPVVVQPDILVMVVVVALLVLLREANSSNLISVMIKVMVGILLRVAYKLTSQAPSLDAKMLPTSKWLDSVKTISRQAGENVSAVMKQQTIKGRTEWKSEQERRNED